MDINQLADKIDIKFEKLNEKLDIYQERVIVVEQKYNSMSGQVKIAFTLIGAVISAIVTYITNLLTK